MNITQRRASVLGVMALAAFVAVVWACDPATPHDAGTMAYPLRCCAGTATHGDCAPIEGVGQIIRHVDGWFIKSSGETIPFDKTEPSTDLRFHRCIKPDNTTRCFFAPESGT